MQYREAHPPAALSDWVHRLWYLRGGDGAEQVVVPDGRPEIIVHLGEPFSVVGPGGEVRRQSEVVVAGQMTRPLRLIPSSDPEMVGIRLTTAGAVAILGVEMSELTDRVPPLHDLNRRVADRLTDALAGRDDVEDRFRAVVGTLHRLAPPRPSALVRRALRMLDATTRLGPVATGCGVTTRTIQRRFRDQVGVAPRLLARIVRFRRAYRMLTSGPPAASARTAALCGYCDQAHMIRDFRRFAGESPARFFRQSNPLADAFLASRG